MTHLDRYDRQVRQYTVTESHKNISLSSNLVIEVKNISINIDAWKVTRIQSRVLLPVQMMRITFM